MLCLGVRQYCGDSGNSFDSYACFSFPLGIALLCTEGKGRGDVLTQQLGWKSESLTNRIKTTHVHGGSKETI